MAEELPYTAKQKGELTDPTTEKNHKTWRVIPSMVVSLLLTKKETPKNPNKQTSKKQQSNQKNPASGSPPLSSKMFCLAQ